ncbi:MAG: Type I restriction-modification system, specificity subunit S [Candidatus Methanosuratincola subterraneus]|uniref:Type I restriction-modification system, specificity subunit S n=1 Tax=Methanosuratincola subterraneus TaxID=2593994 RepID=A0A444L551_METS7|nr:MAG: Type I restriction-modification system, specificity subunit S [Candidatus Methanosuratincola subterraneus]
MFYKETEFQDSPIGKIPKDWNVQELGDESIADIIAGQSPPSSTYNKENHGLPFLQGKMEFGEMFPSPTTYCSEPIKISKKNDVLLSVRAPVGDVNIAPSECCIGRGLAAIRAKADKLNHLFLFYYLKLGGKRFEALSTGSTFKAIRIREIEKFSIPVPSVEEQRGIVGVLGVVDSVIAKTGEVIAKTERLKKGLMQTLLTRGIGHKEYKQTPIGTIPKTWQIVKLGDIISLEYGKGLPQNSRLEGRYPVVGSNGIVGRHNEALVKGPGIVVGRKGTIGAVSWIDEDFWPIDTTYYVKTKRSDVFLRWLFFELSHLNLARLHLADVVPGLKRDLAYSRMLPLPPLQEQQKIAEIITEVDKKLSIEQNEKAKLERIKRGLMDLLLAGKIRVKVD